MTDDDITGTVPAGDVDTAAYFRQRAAWHRIRADVAPDETTRALHQRFARLYMERAGN